MIVLAVVCGSLIWPNAARPTDPKKRIDAAGSVTSGQSGVRPPNTLGRIAAADEFYEASLNHFREEREQLREQSRDLFTKLEKAREVQDWAQAQAPDLRAPPAPLMKKQPRIMSHWQRVREVTAHQFLDFPSINSAGAIRSGRALNFFLDTIGDVALQHERILVRSLVNERFGGQAATGSPNGLSNEENEQFLLLNEIDRRIEIPSRHLREIYCEYGLTNPKMVIRLSSDGVPTADAMPLRWPAFFLVNAEFATHIRSVEAARKEALQEIQTGNLMGPGQRRLMREIDALDADYRSNVSRLHRESIARAERSSRGIRTTVAIGQKDYDICNAQTFMNTLKASLSRLIESRYIGGAAFESRRNRTTVVDLLAHMKQNGLRFAKASPDAEVSYQFLFERMVEYYNELFRYRIARESVVRELESDQEFTEKQIRDSVAFERDFVMLTTQVEAGVKVPILPSDKDNPWLLLAKLGIIGADVYWEHKDRQEQNSAAPSN